MATVGGGQVAGGEEWGKRQKSEQSSQLGMIGGGFVLAEGTGDQERSRTSSLSLAREMASAGEGGGGATAAANHPAHGRCLLPPCDWPASQVGGGEAQQPGTRLKLDGAPLARAFGTRQARAAAETQKGRRHHKDRRGIAPQFRTRFSHILDKKNKQKNQKI